MSPATSPDAGTPAAFFDVDNTIIRGASAFHIARGLRQRGYFRNRDLVRFGWEQAKYLMFGETRKQMTELQVDAPALIKGLSVAEMGAIGEEIYDEVMASRIFPGTLELLEEHLSNGHEVWLVTATPIEIGRLIARRLKATGALGTTLEHEHGHYTGRLVGPMMHGEAKASAITALARERGLDLEESFAYGDSLNDVPMLSLVGNPCPINPDSRMRRYAKKQPWPMREFRGKRGGRRSIVKSSLTGFLWVVLAVLRGIKAVLCRPWRRRR